MTRRLIQRYLNVLLVIAIVSFLVFLWITSKIQKKDGEIWRMRYRFISDGQFAEQPTEYDGSMGNGRTTRSDKKLGGIVRINLDEILQSGQDKVTNTDADNAKTAQVGDKSIQEGTKGVLSEHGEGKEGIVQGFLDIHVWFDICSSSIESLRNFLLFPIAPGFRGKTTTLNRTSTAINCGQRLFGYLSPHISGTYQFKVLSRGSIELWLSSDQDPQKLRIVAKQVDSETSKHDFPISVELNSAKFYFIEVLHKHGDSKTDNYLTVFWKNSNTTNFVPIPSSCLFSLTSNTARIKAKFLYRDTKITSYARDVLTSEELSARAPNKEKDERIKPISEEIVNDVLDTCSYKPSYLIHYKLVRFQGARNKSNTRFLKVYPQDSSNESFPLVKGEKWWEENAVGNQVIDSGTVATITNIFMKALEKRHAGKYELQQVVSIRSTEDKRKGERFFLNLRIRDTTTNATKALLRYVYRKRNTAALCYPENFRWNAQAVIHIVVPIKGCSAWILSLVKNIEEILSSTSDAKINMVMVDYSSQDIDVKQIFQESSIEHFQVVTLPRNESFRRAVALQRAVDAVTDPHGILFFTDLHLSIPRTLFPLIRQHCVEGKMAFAPAVKRLRCGSYPSAPYGYWETLGFGLFAIYKSDFQRVGGMGDLHTFTRWGGEDWELLDRVLMAGIEVERLKILEFYHFYHPALGGVGNSRHNA